MASSSSSYPANTHANPSTHTAAYEQNYSKQINMQMRVPQTITVVDDNSSRSSAAGGDQSPLLHHPLDHISDNMRVPDRIVLSANETGGAGEPQMPADPALPEVAVPIVRSQPEVVQLGTPPRVLTLDNSSMDGGSDRAIAASNDRAMFLLNLDRHDEEEESEIELLQRRVTTLSRDLENLKEEQDYASKIHLVMLGLCLGVSFVNLLRSMRLR